MLIHISAKEFDLAGTMTIKPLAAPSLGSATRRIQRSSTLDGGAVIVDRGFSHADRSLSLQYKPVSAEDEATARRILSLHSRVTIVTREGCFEAAPESFNASAERNTFNFLVVDKLSED